MDCQFSSLITEPLQCSKHIGRRGYVLFTQGHLALCQQRAVKSVVSSLRGMLVLPIAVKYTFGRLSTRSFHNRFVRYLLPACSKTKRT